MHRTARLAAVTICAIGSLCACGTVKHNATPTVTITKTIAVTPRAIITHSSPNPVNVIAPTVQNLNFYCTANSDNSYTLSITNNNAYTVNIDTATVAFYDEHYNIMGETNPEVSFVIPPSQSITYNGLYSQTILGGIPSACNEVQWTKGS
jgi:hypothetical protein